MDYRIKFNAIRDLADARFAASVMAEWMGFSVGKSTDLGIPQILEIYNWCSGPKLTLELAKELDLEQVMTYCNALQVEAIECNLVQKAALEGRLQNIEYILTEGDSGLTHRTHGKSQENILPLLNLVADDIIDADIEQFSMTCFEAKPNQEAGEKDFTLFYDFFEALGVL